jgi:hypothetical protein
VRKIAGELGVDLAEVVGTGRTVRSRRPMSVMRRRESPWMKDGAKSCEVSGG